MNAGIKNVIRKVLYSLLSVVNVVVPKKNQIFVYAGNLLNNNSEIIVRYLGNHDYKVICMASKHMMYRTNGNVDFVNDSVLYAIKYMMTSKVMLDSAVHRIKMRPTSSQLFLNLWHGSPLKYLAKPSRIISDANYYTKICYAADIFKSTIQGMFNASDSQMILNGNLHTDYFYKNFKLPEKYRRTEINVCWMPTYRNGLGVKTTSDDIPIIDRQNIHEINNYLLSNGITLFIKPHILQYNGLMNLFEGGNISNIILITEQDFIDENIPVYGFLKCMDALITDYSSVYFDFLLTDKPIGFAINDFEEYKESVGYVFDNPLDYMPGQIIKTEHDLYTFFDNLRDKNDEFALERNRVMKMTNTFYDGNNCERCYQLIKQYLANLNDI